MATEKAALRSPSTSLKRSVSNLIVEGVIKMISVQEKLNIYRQFLAQQNQEDHDKVIGEAEQRAADEKAAAEVKLAEQEAAIRDHLVRIENRDAVKIVSEGKSYVKDARLRLQKQLTEEFEQEILKLAEDYYGTRAYYDYIKNCVQGLSRARLQPQELTISIRPEDEHVFLDDAREYLPGFTFKFVPPEKNSYGGFTATDKGGRVNYDFTVYNLVESNKKYIGMELRKAMKGVEE